MRRVGIVTTTCQNCGITSYARDLCRELGKHHQCVILEVEPPGIGIPLSAAINADLDVVIINYHEGRIPYVRSEHIRAVQASGKRVILIHHNSFVLGCDSFRGELVAPLYPVADAVVTHEPTVEGSVFIPHGIPEIGNLWGANAQPTVGTAGFPFPWKRTDVVAEVARRTGSVANLICPRHEGLLIPPPEDDWQRMLGERLRLCTEFLPTATVVRLLSTSWLNIFWFQSLDPGDALGQTGSARLGLAARRPVIFSRHRKFRTLFPYEDELYFAETQEEVYMTAAKILGDIAAGRTVKEPKQVLIDQGWSKCGEMYGELIERVLH
jgi:hypothetical protein